MTDRRGRSDRKSIVSDPTLATEDASAVGARVQAHLAERQQLGHFFPVRPQAAPPPAPEQPTTDEQLELLRTQLAIAAVETERRIEAVEARAEVAAGRAARLLAASQSLAAELGRLSTVLPPDVAAELDSAIGRFTARLQSA
jgi:hypothetical protein